MSDSDRHFAVDLSKLYSSLFSEPADILQCRDQMHHLVDWQHIAQGGGWDPSEPSHQPINRALVTVKALFFCHFVVRADLGVWERRGLVERLGQNPMGGH